MATGVLLGLVVPPLAALARPLLVTTLFLPLALALARLEWGTLAAFRSRKTLIAATAAWLLLASPLLCAAIARAITHAGGAPGLETSIVLMSAASPIVSGAAIALILGLDAPLAVVVVVVSTALVPFTLPAFAAEIAHVDVAIDVGALFLRMVLVVGGAFGLAAILRRVAGVAAIERARDAVDGFSVLNIVLFSIAIMDGVTEFALREPRYALTAMAAALGFNLALQLAGVIIFRRAGRTAAVTLAFLSGNRNMGLVLVGLDGGAPFEVVAFFALAQVPMYVLPALLEPLYRRLIGAGASAVESRADAPPR